MIRNLQYSVFYKLRYEKYWVLHKIWYGNIDFWCSEVRYQKVLSVSENILQIIFI
jgi:hypothetical protein